eukprot:m.31299 g.31299  ORF g.31299 m.31299 type:complete len:394 (-) comp16434_c0_seq1:105-1286(-)
MANASNEKTPPMIGPDGKPERQDDRPAIMNMPNSDLNKLPWPFHVSAWFIRFLSSPGTQSGKARLVTIRYSHYCDRARWALDLSPMEYTEDAHPPGLQVIALDPITKGKWSRTPVLVLPDGEAILDSQTIVQRLADIYPDSVGNLYPKDCVDEIRELETEMELLLGANIRQVAYTHVLDLKFLPVASQWFGKGTSMIESFFYQRFRRLIAKGMISLMRCRYSRIPKAEAELDELFVKLGEKLKGRKYLCGDGTKFTAADLTFASLAYPLVLPKEMEEADVLPPLAMLPPVYITMVNKFRKTPAGIHAMRMYSEHRFTKDGPKRVIQPNIHRDRGLFKGLMMIALVLSMILIQLYFAFMAMVAHPGEDPLARFTQDVPPQQDFPKYADNLPKFD